MKKIKLIWWLIQLNVVACFVLFGAVGQSNASTNVKIIAFVTLLFAALLEYFAYHEIYKKHIINKNSNETN